MLLNNLKIALRNLLRYKSFSIINILGLTIGLTLFLAITLYIMDEFSFDRFHTKKDRIYRAVITAEYDGQVNKWGRVPNRVATTAQQEIPEIEKATRYFHHNFGDIAFLSTDDEKFSETQLFYADPELFDIFSIEFVQGNPDQPLSKPGSIVISESAAKKYFAKTDPIGKTITVNNNLSFEVTGVYRDFPGNSSLKANLIASFASNWFGREQNQSWGNASFESFFLLHDGVSKATIDNKIEEMLGRHLEKENRWYTISLQPLLDIHLKSGDLNTSFDRTTYGDINQVKILIALALIILLIAAVNYMNMATALSQRRNKEVGISKTLGATTSLLNKKFYFETGLFVLLAITLSMVLFTTLLPFFNELTGKQVTTVFLSSNLFWTGFVLVGIILTVLAGSYPAWYLSSFSPKAALQKVTTAGTQVMIRKGLVVFQFTVSMVLIVTTIVFYRQMNYIQNKKLGYEPEQVVAIMTSATRDQELIRTLKTEFESLAEVKQVSRSQAYPGIGTSGYTIRHERNEQNGASIYTTRATHEVLDVLGIKLLAGRSLPELKDPNDTTIQVVLNKSAVDYLQLTPEEAIGRQVFIFNNAPAEVVGVTEDFHFASMHQKIGPYCFNNHTDNGYIYLLVKVETNNLMETISTLESTYKKIIPAAFDYTFIDDRMAGLYKAEQKLANVVLTASVIAIFIACLGLYALAAFTAEQRTKEIGIRKVMGASVSQLVTLLSKDFLMLVMIAVVVGIPVSYYLSDRWLESFAYKTSIGISVFILAGSLSLLIAWITVGFESVKASLSNPVNSLRNE
ncbi:MAG: ABC transporter permease [Cyclobacteriaceae bacterium]|nr:ABC transporter permease [Cyclobacteriaceae bacterium]UYN86163.1 MAG: ABC transporter permease [Cyclobacteriaceae bacterium]